MSISLSPRLQVCCGFVAPGDRVADIGCDHGYLSIHLLQSGIASSVIAADINKQPLQSARRNAEKYGVQDRIRFYQSDGLHGIPRGFDTMVCAGMGADTMISILEAAPWLKNDQYRLILQCQSKTPMLRQYLSDQGWRITEEAVVRDGRFLYTVMEVCWQPAYPRLAPWECYFPPALLENPARELPAYYQNTVFRLRRAVTCQGEAADKQLLEVLQGLESLANQPELQWLKEDHQ